MDEQENEVDYFARMFRSMGIALGVCAFAFIVAAKLPGLIKGFIKGADAVDPKKLMDKIKEHERITDSNSR